LACEILVLPGPGWCLVAWPVMLFGLAGGVLLAWPVTFLGPAGEILNPAAEKKPGC
jgi:hypothetical protein